MLAQTLSDDNVGQRRHVAFFVVGERPRERHCDFVFLVGNEVGAHVISEIGEIATELIGEFVARFFREENVEKFAARVFGENRPVATDQIDSARFSLRGELFSVERQHFDSGVFLLFEQKHLLEDVIDVDLQIFVLFIDLRLQLAADLQRSTL